VFLILYQTLVIMAMRVTLEQSFALGIRDSLVNNPETLQESPPLRLQGLRRVYGQEDAEKRGGYEELTFV
jgi:hypothetical protein